MEAEMVPVAIDGARSDSLVHVANVDKDRNAGVSVASRTVDGAKKIRLDGPGTEADRIPPPLAPYVSESGSRGFRKVVSRHGPESPILQSRPPSFRMRKSGSTPSLLTLEMPRSESSHSLIKYSLSSGMPATGHPLSPVQSNERTGNRVTMSEQYVADESKMTAHDTAHGVPNSEFVLPPLSRLT
ncbi:hypothetical protein MBRA1_000040 [Malassezia brasiliensis]|uniref:Uncharacterized protein n=1 Tax=Malassezia brasiliensis TaxID=1821822 RepID=A0AAF0IN56_9BASI|nr:hypothetical protein MBRA1_000040 [Malassezia brasiliensis]